MNEGARLQSRVLKKLGAEFEFTAQFDSIPNLFIGSYQGNEARRKD